MTPSHDQQGNPLMPDQQFEQIHMLEREQFDQLPEATKQLYQTIYEHHQAIRMGGEQMNPAGIVTSSGMTYEELAQLGKNARTQQGK